MNDTPKANRPHIAIFGKVNAGKSTVFNLILGQQAAIVSEVAGTTTDPVEKNMELLPVGPITLIDTAGLSDSSELGGMRQKRTEDILRRADYALCVFDAESFDRREHKEYKQLFEKHKLSFLTVFTRAARISAEALSELKKEFNHALFIEAGEKNAPLQLRARLASELSKLIEDGESLISSFVSPGAMVLLICPIDSEAPKGRLILPQVQLLRECLDAGIIAMVCKETEIDAALGSGAKFDLVVADSQVIGLAAKAVPESIPLTSFSMLLASRFGSIDEFKRGAEVIDSLKDGDKILFAEACTHNYTHEDIARVKIPAMLKKRTGKQLEYVYYVGYDFPDNLKDYALVVHCGGCMINRKSLRSRVEQCKKEGAPITNYGVLIAYCQGVLERSAGIFNKVI